METSSPGSMLRAAAMLSSRDRLAGCLPAACERTTVSRFRVLGVSSCRAGPDSQVTAIAGERAGGSPRHEQTILELNLVLLATTGTSAANLDLLARLQFLELYHGVAREVATDHTVPIRFQLHRGPAEPVFVHAIDRACDLDHLVLVLRICGQQVHSVIVVELPRRDCYGLPFAQLLLFLLALLLGVAGVFLRDLAFPFNCGLLRRDLLVDLLEKVGRDCQPDAADEETCRTDDCPRHRHPAARGLAGRKYADDSEQ